MYLLGMGAITGNVVIDPANWDRNFSPDDLSAAAGDFAKLGPAYAPSGGGSMADLVASVATNPAYAGSVPSKPMAFGPWLQANGIMIGLGLGAAALLVGIAKR